MMEVRNAVVLDVAKDEAVQLRRFVRFHAHFLSNLIDSAQNFGGKRVELVDSSVSEESVSDLSSLMACHSNPIES